jgi:predicted permease
MNWHAEIRARLSQASREPNDDVIEELAQHAAAAFERARADGVDTAAATDRVRRMIDGWCEDPSVVSHRPRRSHGPSPFEGPYVPGAHARGLTGLAADIRYGVRQLRRQPGFAVTAILVSALGIGVATTIFSVAYGVLMRPLPWPEPDRLVRITEVREGATRTFAGTTTNATYLAWKDDPATIQAIAAYSTENVSIGIGAAVQRKPILRTTAALFAVLGVRPALGGLFTEADERQPPAKTVVLSHDFWQQQLGGRTDVVGQAIEIEGAAHVIAGIMPKGFYFPEPVIVGWVPRFVTPVTNPANPQSRGISIVRSVARLKPGATPEQASADGTARSRSGPDLGMVGVAMFGTKGAVTVTATRYLDAVTADVKPALVVLLWAVGLLVVAGTANIAGLQLARALGRTRELAIRSALGAGTGRIVRQMITESLVLGFAGGLGGFLLAASLHRLLPSVMPSDFPRMTDVAVDWRVAAFAALAALFATLVVGLLPARLAMRRNLVNSLTEDGQAPVATGLRSHAGRLRAGVMAAQVAVAALLLVGASLLTRSFVALMAVDRGYDPQNLLTAELPTPDRLYSPERRKALIDSLLERLRTVPGVQHVAAANGMPLAGFDSMMGFRRTPPPGQPGAPVDVQSSIRAVTPDYFAALGIRVVAGRGFAEADVTSPATIILVNETFARRYLTGDPVGQVLPVSFDPKRPDQQTIVGVVRDAQHGRPTDPQQPQIYVLYRQRLDFSVPLLLVRTDKDPSALVPILERLVREQDRAIAPEKVMTMEAKLGASVSRPRLYALLLTGFAGFAVLICGIGLFGAMSQSVTQRRREIGVRAALGARPASLVRLVVGQAVVLTAAGTAVGLVAAWFLAKQVGTLLFGVTVHDAISFGVVPILLLVAAALACALPARRATRVDPITVLRPQ